MHYLLPFAPDIPRTQDFGHEQNNAIVKGGPHNGDDYGTPVGTPVHAAGDGIIEFAGEFDDTYWDNFAWNTNMAGLIVWLNCDGDTAPRFEYGHLSKVLVTVGQRVKRGDVIALTGNSGGSTGPHCHVGALPPVYDLNTPTYGRVNPRRYMTEHPDTETEDEEMSKAAENMLVRLVQIAEAGENDRIRERIIAIDDRTAVSLHADLYVKGTDEDTLYEINENTGELRGIGKAEWELTGRGYRTLPQATINLLPRV